MPEAENSCSGVEAETPVEKADRMVLRSRLEAYQQTCHKQGTKLTRIESLLFAESDQGKAGDSVNLLNLANLTFKDGTLQAIADVLKEKGSNR